MKLVKYFFIAFAVLLLLTGCRFSLFDLLPKSGSLDDSFGSGGKVVTPIGMSHDMIRAVAFQPDGKIVAAGYTHNGSDYDLALARYNTDGTLDASFGSGGVVKTDFGMGADNFGRAVAIQEDGKIVVAGYSDSGSNNDFALVRYNTDGTLDASFGSGGIVTHDIAADDIATEITIQQDQKIVVAGFCGSSNKDFALMRCNTDGSLDASFGSLGIVTTDIVSTDNFGFSVAIQEDGKIVAAGYSGSVSTDFALVRYNTDGSLDPTFGSGGKVTQDIAANDSAQAITIQQNQKIVVAGYSGSGSTDFALVRYNTDGTLDTSFGSLGIVTTDIASTNDQGHAVALQSDEKILVFGITYSGSVRHLALVRYNTDGSLDASFGSDGIVTTSFGLADSFGYALSIQPEGMIAAAGYYHNGSDYDFALARYWP